MAPMGHRITIVLVPITDRKPSQSKPYSVDSAIEGTMNRILFCSFLEIYWSQRKQVRCFSLIPTGGILSPTKTYPIREKLTCNLCWDHTINHHII